ncbi:hypothetical protein [Caballeronia sp. S22]|uniref:hypothetical protein n=1 Tax=Caballeronia sp. S22 TaxID=3137182 RepID=UPI0035308B6D
MDWFRWWHGTVNDPKFGWVARKSGQSVASVVAVWAALLECASTATQCNADATRGNVASFDCNDYDVAFGLEDGSVRAIFDAMIEKKLIVDGRLTRWDERQPKREDSGNPNTGALSSTERSRLHRDKKRRDATHGNDMQRNATLGNDREEEIRRELTLTNPKGLVVASNADDSSAQRPKSVKSPCPHQEIIALYHELLPTSPVIRDWTTARAEHLRVRWNEDEKRQDLEWWRRFFSYVAQSEFLTGRAGSGARKPFTPGLDWICKAENFAKIREGRFHDAEAA